MSLYREDPVYLCYESHIGHDATAAGDEVKPDPSQYKAVNVIRIPDLKGETYYTKMATLKRGYIMRTRRTDASWEFYELLNFYAVFSRPYLKIFMNADNATPVLDMVAKATPDAYLHIVIRDPPGGGPEVRAERTFDHVGSPDEREYYAADYFATIRKWHGHSTRAAVTETDKADKSQQVRENAMERGSEKQYTTDQQPTATGSNQSHPDNNEDKPTEGAIGGSTSGGANVSNAARGAHGNTAPLTPPVTPGTPKRVHFGNLRPAKFQCTRRAKSVKFADEEDTPTPSRRQPARKAKKNGVGKGDES